MPYVRPFRRCYDSTILTVTVPGCRLTTHYTVAHYSNKIDINNKIVIISLSTTAFNRLLMSGASLLALHAGRYYKEPDGLSLGPGAFVRALEYSAGTGLELVTVL